MNTPAYLTIKFIFRMFIVAIINAAYSGRRLNIHIVIVFQLGISRSWIYDYLALLQVDLFVDAVLANRVWNLIVIDSMLIRYFYRA